MYRIQAGIISASRHLINQSKVTVENGIKSRSRHLSTSSSQTIIGPAEGTKTTSLLTPPKHNLLLPERPNWLSPSTTAGLISAYSTDGSDPKEKDRGYPIVFADSGAGGLIFLLQSYGCLEQFLLDLQSRYRVKFELVHVGDASNAPYGDRKFDEIQGLTKDLITYAATKVGSTKVILACNTASTTVNPDFREWSKKEHPNVHVMAIIKHTARALYNDAVTRAVNTSKPDTYVGILATPATIKSQQYAQALAALHAEKYIDYANLAPTVVINNDSRLDPGKPFTRVYMGQTPIVPGTSDERDIIREIRAGKNQVPVQYVVVHAPPNWVPLLEGRAAGNLSLDVRQEMVQFFNQCSNNPLLEVDPQKIKVLGACCTHYPFMSQDIASVFGQFNVNAEIKTQGPILADIAMASIRGDFERNDGVRERHLAIPREEMQTPLIRIESRTTFNHENPADHASAKMAKKIAYKINPTLASLTEFKTIDRLDK